MKRIDYYRSEPFNMVEVKTCSNDIHAYKDHLHQELSIGYIEKGSSILNINGSDYYMKAGEAIMIYPYVSHKCQPLDLNDWKFTMIYIQNEFCEEMFHHLGSKNAIGIKKLGTFEFNQIQSLVDVLKSNTSGFDKEVELISTLIHLFDVQDIAIQLQSSKKITAVKAYIEENFLEPLKLKDMEEKFDISKFVLIRNFKSQFNTTPSAYQLQLKTDYGKCLLKSSDDIVDIALKSGFYDQAHFTKEFKKAYGITPFQYYKALHD
ncbi:AraC-like DNA-binding protein [Anaerosolibacter carboniphilus]|uniref:AraC-like DNA-binding protein n=1 Tax=Anaerosolibacter carboniphilus TaxID=1417629 RepID=A0A841KKX3_9FIRM|nr:AraC family transcriptional regulator [Anaerosolibacter carboniphilus]MBB6214504.1 AraC-like DNA-binding protein [Anaerosolibacter carboniphilus]